MALPRADGTGGNIYTCSNATIWSVYDANNIIANCSSPLRVNGMFLANRVKFLRTYSSLRHGMNNESPMTPNTNPTCILNIVSKPPAMSTCAAEEFVAGPETWLTMPSNGLLPTTSDYESFTSLPPIL
jgi:hypothetical protein